MKLILPLLLTGLLLDAACLRAANLGSTAPELKIQKWVKGEPAKVAEAKGDHVYVVEFWATWCPPCRESIPHLSGLQQKFKDKVTFIGISDEEEPIVKKFVKGMGDKMAYTVAIDDDRKTSADYMQAFGIDGIPHAFVVQNDKIIWHGHPMDRLEETLDEVVAGKYDIKTAEARSKTMELLEKFQAAVSEENDKEADAIADQIEVASKGLKGLFENDKFDRAAQKKEIHNEMELNTTAQAYFKSVSTEPDSEKAAKLGAKLAELVKDQPSIGNRLAWMILTSDRIKQRDLPLALSVAKTACEKSNWSSPEMIGTYARALFDSGKKDEAIDYEKKAVNLATSPSLKQELEENLKNFQEKKTL